MTTPTKPAAPPDPQYVSVTEYCRRSSISRNGFYKREQAGTVAVAYLPLKPGSSFLRPYVDLTRYPPTGREDRAAPDYEPIH